MQTPWFVVAAAAILVCTNTFAADQSGAEKQKKVVSAEIVAHGPAKSGEAQVIGNVQVTYADGSKDLWTTKGNCSLAKVADSSTVGWTVHGAPVHINSGEPIHPNPELVICRQGKIIAQTKAGKPFIEDWRFLEGGRQFALRCRGGHGPADIELHETATGKLIASVDAYGEKLPAWAKPLKDDW